MSLEVHVYIRQARRESAVASDGGTVRDAVPSMLVGKAPSP
jgi:hypothetical protein